MQRRVLRGDPWARIKALLPGKASDRGVTAEDNRLFVEAVLWIGHTGAPWRDLPPQLGNWHTTFTRFARWAKAGPGSAGVPGHQQRPGLGGGDARQHHRTRPPACRGRSKKHGPQALGRSRGGFGTTLHAIVDALGNPIGFTLTGAEQADITQTPAWLDHAPCAQAVIADKGYDADALVERIESQQAAAISPPRSNRKRARAYDRHRYPARNLIERCFNRLKQFRRVATRYEKLTAHCAAMVTGACIVLWLA